jgi:hypothetical protein
MKNIIKKKNQQHVLYTLQQLTDALEHVVDPKKDNLDKQLVESGYDVLNYTGYTQKRAYWET